MKIAVGSRAAIGFFAMLAVSAFCGVASVSAQTIGGVTSGVNTHGQPKIIISPLDAPSGDPVAADIASTVSESLALVLRLSGSFTVIHADFLDPVRSYRRSVIYYRQHEARIGVFGEVRPAAGGNYLVTVEYWRAAAASAAPRKFTTTIKNVFAVFDAADRIALEVASAAAGRRLSQGTVVIENTGKLGKYAVYADGQLVARNRNRVHVLTGQRTIIVAVPGPVGDLPVETFKVDVKEGATTTITLNEAAASGRATGGTVGGRSKQAPPQPAQKKPTNGSLSISTNPAGATVLLDGKRVGTTPLKLAAVSVGSHTLSIARRYFHAVHRVVRIRAGESSAIDVDLSVDPQDPGIEKRMINPLGTTGGSLLWTAAQVVDVGAVGSVAGAQSSTSSFWVSQPFPQGVSLGEMLFIDSNLVFPRIGNRLAGDGVLTDIGTVATLTAATLGTIELAPSWSSPSATQSGSYSLLSGGVLSGLALITVLADVLYDPISAPFGAMNTNKELLQYVAQHGTLPRVVRLRPHRIIIETGGDSFVRAGYRLPLLANFLAVDAAAGVGAGTLSPFRVAISGTAELSYNPWGATTGSVRPELFLGIRASTDFSSVGLWPVFFGTGTDIIGKYFDIFTRGGFGYDVVNGRWDQSFTMGTRIF